ncbi:predicted Fe-S protein [Vibrio mimicus VM223]|nr:predicted Fe-S protein [Vibrio mimicus VM223]
MTPAQKLHVIKLCRQRYRRKQAEARGQGKTENLSESGNAATDAQQDLF